MVRLGNGGNNIFVTITENGFGDYYVLRVVDNMNYNVERLCILGVDNSPYITRYNWFLLTVADTAWQTQIIGGIPQPPVYNNQILVLDKEGQYNYEIFAMSGVAPVGEEPILYNGTLLEKGRIFLSLV
jgi:hypothetical protein